jgi:menaquinone-dependent protoporphyrinogen IX oxidase
MTMVVLVGYATEHGSTQGAAMRIRDRLQQHGVAADVRPMSEVQDLSRYDAAVLGSAIHDGKWLPPARQFVDRNAAGLRERPVWMFSVSTLGDEESMFDARPQPLATREVRLMENPLRSPGRGEVVAERPPLAYPVALRALAGCFANSARLLWQRRMHLPRGRVWMRLQFADGTSARVYRETAVDRGPTLDPCVLIVEFRLRAVRGRGHAAFRVESMLNTPLFVGFPGFVSKLWLADDERGRYRGVYEWDGPQLAENYARALWRVLALVSVRGSVHYVVLPGLRRDVLLDRPTVAAGAGESAAAWWRLAGAG